MASTRSSTKTPPPHKKRMTLREFEAFERAHKDERWELIEGQPVMTPSPLHSHQDLSFEICAFLKSILKSSAGWYVIQDTSLRVSSLSSEIRPDIAVYKQKELKDGGEFPLTATPKLVVECLSSNVKTDMVDKRSLYHKVGVPEYWVVDPKTGAISLFVRRKSEYDQLSVDPKGFIESPLLKQKLRIVVEQWAFRIVQP